MFIANVNITPILATSPYSACELKEVTSSIDDYNGWIMMMD